MSDYDDLLKRFCAAAGCKFVMKHYAEFPLDAMLLDTGGKCIAVVELAVKNFAMYEHTHYMQTIWKLEEGREASEKKSVPYLILCKFKDGDAFYQFDTSHEQERRMPKPDATLREGRAISNSVFIPMQYWLPFQRWPTVMGSPITAKKAAKQASPPKIVKIDDQEFDVVDL